MKINYLSRKKFSFTPVKQVFEVRLGLPLENFPQIKKSFVVILFLKANSIYYVEFTKVLVFPLITSRLKAAEMFCFVLRLELLLLLVK